MDYSACVASIMRLVTSVQARGSKDVTWALLPEGLWGYVPFSPHLPDMTLNVVSITGKENSAAESSAAVCLQYLNSSNISYRSSLRNQVPGKPTNSALEVPTKRLSA